MVLTIGLVFLWLKKYFSTLSFSEVILAIVSLVSNKYPIVSVYSKLQ